MKIVSHKIDQTKIAEITSDHIIINSAEDGLDLLGNLYSIKVYKNNNRFY